MRLYKFNPKPHSQSVEQVKEKTSAWKLGGLSPIQLGKQVSHEIDHDEVFTRCAGLSYYFLTALIPMALFLISALFTSGLTRNRSGSGSHPDRWSVWWCWIGASVVFRVYLHYFNSYSKSYGSLGAVIVLLLWLYITGLAILTGGEINSEIEIAAAKRGHPEAKDAGEKAA